LVGGFQYVNRGEEIKHEAAKDTKEIQINNDDADYADPLHLILILHVPRSFVFNGSAHLAILGVARRVT